jgi:hypothetical protein
MKKEIGLREKAFFVKFGPSIFYTLTGQKWRPETARK